MNDLVDTADGRVGEWMHTSLGNRFFPQDVRPGDIHISDIANGLALDCRYGGQGQVTRFYSVAEHSYHMANWARSHGRPPAVQLAVLLHDAAEAYINDLPRAVKHAVGAGYSQLENEVQQVINYRYDIVREADVCAPFIKALDQRIVPLEKAAIMKHPQPWAFDKFEALEDVEIMCWDAVIAKTNFLFLYHSIMTDMGQQPEGFEI